jgi:hypothetical protein
VENGDYDMERMYRFTGILGLVLLGFGTIGVLVTGYPNSILLLAHFLIGLACTITWALMVGMKNIGKSSAVIRGRHVRYGINAILYSTVFIGLLAAVNWLGSRHNKRWDFTEQGVYSLSDQSKRILASVEKKIKLVGFRVGEQADLVQDLLNLYRDYKPTQVTVEMVDPRSKPQRIEQMQMKPGNVLYLEYGEGTQKQTSRLNEVTEEAITNTILKMVRGSARKVYVITGHGEPGLDVGTQGGLDQFVSAIKDEHYEVQPLLLGRKGAVPEDAAAALLISPKQPLLPEERTALVNYAQKGGRLIMFADPQSPSDKSGSTDVKEIAAQFGIEVGDEVAVNLVRELFSGLRPDPVLYLQDFADHPSTRGLGKNSMVAFELARPVRKAPGEIVGASVTELAKTTAGSWGVKNVAALFATGELPVQKSAEDVEGPIPVAAAYEKKIETAKNPEGETGLNPVMHKVSRVLVFGDSDWIVNGPLLNEFKFNREFALNSVNWASGEEGGISIRPRAMKSATSVVSRDVIVRLLVSSLIIPEMVLIGGLFVWWRRREVSVA